MSCFSWCLVWFWLVFLGVCSGGWVASDISCSNVVSGQSDDCDDCTTWVSCSDSDQVMTGCTGYTKWNELDGSYISGERCYAKNGNGGNGVWAHARCCDIHVSSCDAVTSSLSEDCDDCSITATCSDSDDVLTGCTMYTSWKEMDGGYAGAPEDRYDTSQQDHENHCTARNGDGGNGIRAQARCCEAQDDYRLSCFVKWSEKSGTSDDDLARVSCDSGYFLTGCSVYTRWKEIDGSYFDDDECIAQNGSGGNGVWAVATCCKEEYWE